MPANQITTFLDPAQLPARKQEQDTFDDYMALFMQLLPTFGAQFNAGVANFNAAAAGGAYAIPYTIDLSGTSDIDPGSGKLRFDSATQNLANTLRLDLIGSNLVDYTAMLDTFDLSTSIVKGTLRIVKLGDSTKQLQFDVTARTAPSGYRDIAVTPRWSSSSNPFVDGDGVLVFFTRNGDKGDPGTGSLIYLGGASLNGTTVSTIDFLNIIDDNYESFTIEIAGLSPNPSAYISLQLAAGGVVQTGLTFTGSANTFGGNNLNSAGSYNYFPLTSGSNTTSDNTAGLTATIEIRNARATNCRKWISARGVAHSDAPAAAPFDLTADILFLSALSGFRLIVGGSLGSTGGNFYRGKVRVFGKRNV